MDAQLQQSWDWQSRTKQLYNNWRKAALLQDLGRHQWSSLSWNSKKAWALKQSYQQKKKSSSRSTTYLSHHNQSGNNNTFSRFINSQAAVHTLGEFLNISVPWDPWEVVFLLTLHSLLSYSGVNLAALLSQTASVNTTVATSTAAIKEMSFEAQGSQISTPRKIQFIPFLKSQFVE